MSAEQQSQDIQVSSERVIHSLSQRLNNMTMELAVKDALIEQLQAQLQEVRQFVDEVADEKATKTKRSDS